MKAKLFFLILLYISISSIFITTDVFNDEASYFFRSRTPFNEMLTNDVHPFLYLLLVKFMPQNIICLRLLSMLFTVCSLIIFYYFLEGFTNLKGYIMALLILNPYFIKFGMKAQPYALALMFSMIALYSYFQILNNDKKSYVILFFLSCIGGILTHSFFILLLGIFFLNFFIRLFYGVILVKNIELTFYMLILPLCISFLVFLNYNWHLFFMHPALNFRTFTPILVLYTLVFFFVNLVLPLLFVISLGMIKPDIFEKSILLVMFAPLLVSFIIPIWNDRYFFILMPLFFLMFWRRILAIKKVYVKYCIIIFYATTCIYTMIDVNYDGDPIQESMKAIPQTYPIQNSIYHQSSFSFLPYEFYNFQCNMLINNTQIYHTPIYQEYKLRNSYPTTYSYYLIGQSDQLNCTAIFDKNNLKVCFIQ